MNALSLASADDSRSWLATPEEADEGIVNEMAERRRQRHCVTAGGDGGTEAEPRRDGYKVAGTGERKGGLREVKRVEREFKPRRKEQNCCYC